MRLPKDIVPGCVLLVLAAVYAYAASGLPAGRSGDPGPALFPFILAGALAVFSLVLMGKSLLATYREGGAAPAADTGPKDYSGFIRLAITIALTVLFVASFSTLGYIIGTTLYAGLLSLLFRRDSFVIPIAAGVVTTAMLYIFFVMLLGIRLPLGLLQ